MTQTKKIDIVSSQSKANPFPILAHLRHTEPVYLLRRVASLLDQLAGRDVDKSHLQLLRQVAREESHRQYRRLMSKIIDALREGGEKGRRASKLTITRYLEILIDEPLSVTGSIAIRQREKPAKR